MERHGVIGCKGYFEKDPEQRTGGECTSKRDALHAMVSPEHLGSESTFGCYDKLVN